MIEQKKCNYWKCANSIGLFLVILFAICFFWYFIRPIEQDLHLRLFKMAFLGFSDMSPLSFIFGAIQTYIWAYIGIGVWYLVGCRYRGEKSEE